MPCGSNAELPQSVRDKYSDKCQRAFRHAFNPTHSQVRVMKARRWHLDMQQLNAARGTKAWTA